MLPSINHPTPLNANRAFQHVYNVQPALLTVPDVSKDFSCTRTLVEPVALPTGTVSMGNVFSVQPTVSSARIKPQLVSSAKIISTSFKAAAF
jgi:hypothetical protein